MQEEEEQVKNSGPLPQHVHDEQHRPNNGSNHVPHDQELTAVTVVHDDIAIKKNNFCNDFVTKINLQDVHSSPYDMDDVHDKNNDDSTGDICCTGSTTTTRLFEIGRAHV